MIARLEARSHLPFAELDVPTDAARIKAPILVIHDRNDAVVSITDAEAIVDAAPRGRLVVTEGLGHRRILRDRGVAEEIVVVRRRAGAHVQRDARRRALQPLVPHGLK